MMMMMITEFVCFLLPHSIWIKALYKFTTHFTIAPITKYKFITPQKISLVTYNLLAMGHLAHH
jgi:hypothetical protein